MGKSCEVEKRIDKNDGHMYDVFEFLHHYGGLAEWHDAFVTEGAGYCFALISRTPVVETDSPATISFRCKRT